MTTLMEFPIVINPELETPEVHLGPFLPPREISFSGTLRFPSLVTLRKRAERLPRGRRRRAGRRFVDSMAPWLTILDANRRRAGR